MNTSPGEPLKPRLPPRQVQLPLNVVAGAPLGTQTQESEKPQSSLQPDTIFIVAAPSSSSQEPQPQSSVEPEAIFVAAPPQTQDSEEPQSSVELVGKVVAVLSPMNPLDSLAEHIRVNIDLTNDGSIYDIQETKERALKGDINELLGETAFALGKKLANRVISGKSLTLKKLKSPITLTISLTMKVMAHALAAKMEGTDAGEQ